MKIALIALIINLSTHSLAQTISFDPDIGQVGTSLSVTITGTNTNFVAISSTCIQILATPSMMEMTDVEVISAVLMEGTLVIPCRIDIGNWDAMIFNQSCDSLAVMCPSCFETYGPPNLTITSTAASGLGTLREMIDCATSGDTVRFDDALENLTITLAAPTINVNKEIYLYSDLTRGLTISNSNDVNTSSLIDVSEALYSHGLKWEGLTSESLIIEIFIGGSFNVSDSEIDKINIRKN